MTAPKRSFSYPTNHLLGVVDDPADAARAAAALAEAGFDQSRITLLRGTEGAERIDGLGGRRSSRRLVRITQFMTMDQMPDFWQYEAAIRDGRVVVAVEARNREALLKARDVLTAAGGHFLNYFGRLSTEEFSRWRGLELPMPEFLRR